MHPIEQGYPPPSRASSDIWTLPLNKNILISGNIHKTLATIVEEQATIRRALKKLRIPITTGTLPNDHLEEGTLPLSSKPQLLALEVKIRDPIYHQQVVS